MTPTPDDLSVFESIAEKLDAVEASIAAESELREQEIVAANLRAEKSEHDAQESKRKARHARRFAWVAFVAALLGGLGSLKANDALETAKVDRADRARGACIQFNVQQKNQRDADVAGLLALLPPGALLTPAQQQALDRYKTALEVQLPYRDCSSSGIDAFLKNPPPDPNAGG